MALGFCSLVCSCAPLPLCHMPGSGGQFSRAGLLLLALTAVEGERQGEIRTAGGMLLSIAQKSCRSSLLDFNLGPVQTLTGTPHLLLSAGAASEDFIPWRHLGQAIPTEKVSCDAPSIPQSYFLEGKGDRERRELYDGCRRVCPSGNTVWRLPEATDLRTALVFS